MTGGHTNYVNYMLRINANQVATVSDDNLLVIWNINTSSPVNTYHSHSSKVQGIAILPNGYLATCGFDYSIRVWDLANELLVATNYLPGMAYGMKWSAANGMFVVSMANYLVMFSPSTYLWYYNVTTGKTFYGIDILQPSGKLIAVGQSYLIIYNLPTFTVFKTLASPPSLTRVKLMPDNVTVVLGCTNGQVRVYNSITYSISTTYTAHTNGKWVLMLEVSPDQQYLFSGAQDSNIIMWTLGYLSLTQVKSMTSAAILNSGVIVSGAYSGGEKNILIKKLK
jgi:WD40 repeat protein